MNGHDDAARRAVLSALDMLLRALNSPLQVTVSTTTGQLATFFLPAGESVPVTTAPAAVPLPQSVQAVPGPAREDDGRNPQADILAVLHAAGRRLTGEQVMADLEGRGWVWGETTVRRHLAALTSSGALRNDGRAHPPGYAVAIGAAPCSPRPDDEPDCTADILAVLRSAGRRLTGEQIMVDLGKSSCTWGEATVWRHLAAITKDGTLDNDPRAKPPGYSLAAGATQSVPKRDDDEGDCREDILDTLRAAGRRLTTRQLLSDMEKAGTVWGEATVKRHLAGMVSDLILDNDSRARPPGYAVAGESPAPTLAAQRQLVTIDQAAALVNRDTAAVAKRADLPPATVPGANGEPALYAWPTLRPWLEGTFSKRLPERFPG